MWWTTWKWIQVKHFPLAYQWNIKGNLYQLTTFFHFPHRNRHRQQSETPRYSDLPFREFFHVFLFCMYVCVCASVANSTNIWEFKLSSKHIKCGYKTTTRNILLYILEPPQSASFVLEGKKGKKIEEKQMTAQKTTLIFNLSAAARGKDGAKVRGYVSM